MKQLTERARKVACEQVGRFSRILAEAEASCDVHGAR